MRWRGGAKEGHANNRVEVEHHRLDREQLREGRQQPCDARGGAAARGQPHAAVCSHAEHTRQLAAELEATAAAAAAARRRQVRRETRGGGRKGDDDGKRGGGSAEGGGEGGGGAEQRAGGPREG